jgi:undecaprenol kinase
MKNKTLFTSIKHALNGCGYALRNERNFRLHLFSVVLSALALIALRPGALWIAVIILAIGMVLGAELLNTAVERLADHLHPQQHEAIRVVKDCAAAAVLVSALMAIAVAICLAVHMLGN